MIKVIAKMMIQEDQVEGFTNNFISLVEKARKEEGCLEYNLYRDVNIKNQFNLIEEWDSPEALQSHMQSKHFQEMISELNQIMEQGTEVSVCTQVL